MTMRKIALFPLLLLLAVNAFGHAGEVHTYMGSVSAVNGDGSFTLDGTDGKTHHVAVAQSTVFRNADGSPAAAADLAVGKRVVATISTDGKTASMIKFAKRK